MKFETLYSRSYTPSHALIPPQHRAVATLYNVLHPISSQTLGMPHRKFTVVVATVGGQAHGLTSVDVSVHCGTKQDLHAVPVDVTVGHEMGYETD